MDQLIETLFIPFLTSIAGAFSGWFFGRRKQTAEAVQSELESVEKAVSIWREIAQDLKKEMAEQGVQIQKLQNEVATLRRDNARLLTELKQIKKVQNQQTNE
jgi:septal ring factor EnvC (AmiA/AmiB activator)